MANKNLEQLVHIQTDAVTLEGTLALPEGTGAVVIFAHGSGSSRHSSRNRFVAGVLQKAGIGTLLFDLLTQEEDTVYETRFNIPLLTERLIATTQWLKERPQAEKFGTGNLNTGYFGASTGAASALGAAAALGNEIRAVVSRGGRPDLAMESIGQVLSPVLLIVGGMDDVVIQLNRQAYGFIKAEKALEIVPGATHLFEEPGTLEEVARLATEWFSGHLTSEESGSTT
jgi:dienelactone hydrolase